MPHFTYGHRKPDRVSPWDPDPFRYNSTTQSSKMTVTFFTNDLILKFEASGQPCDLMNVLQS